MDNIKSGMGNFTMPFWVPHVDKSIVKFQGVVDTGASITALRLFHARAMGIDTEKLDFVGATRTACSNDLPVAFITVEHFALPPFSFNEPLKMIVLQTENPGNVLLGMDIIHMFWMVKIHYGTVLELQQNPRWWDYILKPRRALDFTCFGARERYNLYCKEKESSGVKLAKDLLKAAEEMKSND